MTNHNSQERAAITTNLTAPANNLANGPITVKLITRFVEELRRSPELQSYGDMAYLIADTIKGLGELLECRRREEEKLLVEKNFRICVDTISRLISNKINVYCSIKSKKINTKRVNSKTAFLLLYKNCGKTKKVELESARCKQKNRQSL